ncbi:MAG: T9SS type A sorting domain-containing protein [Winogradskyella sp.]|jgi:Flp pilus assembly pilin Flp
MKKILLFFILLPFLGLGQVQIGQDIDGETTGDQSGYSVSISDNGSVLAIGAFRNDANGDNSGHVRVFENIGGIWTQIGNDIDGDLSNDFFGVSLNLNSNGNILAVGASNGSVNGTSSGLVKVYQNQSGSWIQIGQTISGEVAQDRFGREVSLSADGNILAVSSLYHNNGRGHVRIFENISGVWTQIGSDIEGEFQGDLSGWSLNLSSDGSIVAIGARNNDGSGNSRGHVRIFENIGGVWTQIGSDIDGEADGDLSGSTMSLSANGSIVAIGSIFNSENGNSRGHVRIFENIGGVWMQIGSDIDGEADGDLFGYSVSLSSSGDIVAIGATNNDGNGNNSGRVKIFQNQSGVWTQVGNNIDGEAADDRSGYRISLSSDANTVAIGSIYNDGNGDDSGHVRAYDLSALLSVEEQKELSFSIFPNPTKNQFTIQLKNSLSLNNVNIYDNLGKLVLTSKESTINTSILSSGLYIVEVVTTEAKGIKKLIIE